MFKREICALILTLVIFSLTYMMRGVWDLKNDPNSSAFVVIVMDMTIFVFCDFLPIMFLLIFHFRNFNKREEKVTQEEAEWIRTESVDE